MTDLPKCPVCGMPPALRVRSRGMNWGSAEVRCSNGCRGIRAGFSFPPDGMAAARQLLQEKWKELVGAKRAIYYFSNAQITPRAGGLRGKST